MDSSGGQLAAIHCGLMIVESQPVTRIFPVDLQVHSNCSDGTDTPQELVAKAAAAGIRVLAITDHDSVLGVAAAQARGAEAGVHLLPAIEFSTARDRERDFRDFDILGYGIDPTDPTLLETLDRLKDSRVEQKTGQVERLQSYGLHVPVEEVMALAKGVPGRPHIAQIALKYNPHRFSSISDVFQKYLASDAEHSTHVRPSFILRVEDAIELTRAAGGKTVLAHPGIYRRIRSLEDSLRRLVDLGLDGLETYYPYAAEGRYATERPAASFAELAARFGLFATGGSDYHGERKGNRLGEAGLEWEQWERLRDENGW